jgi:hypothetical protein
MPPAFPASVTRRFSEFANERAASEEDDFDTRMTGGYDGEAPEEEGYEEGDEYEEEDDQEPSYLPARPNKADSPVAVEPDRYTFDDGDEEEDEDDNDALAQDIQDLEAELVKAFEKADNEGNESDSSVSEEE